MGAREPTGLPFLWTPQADGAAAVSLAGARSASGAPVFFGIEGNEDLQNPFVFERAFTAAECEAIRAIASRLAPYRGLSSAAEAGYRVCTTAFVEQDAASAFVFDRLRALARALNRRYRFRLEGFTEPLHFIAYEPGGRFEWHSDLGEGHTSTRKIAISVQLTDPEAYDGGDLEFCPHGRIAEFRGLGNALAFPAYLPHRVAPVTRGRRDALVAWIHGPAFD